MVLSFTGFLSLATIFHSLVSSNNLCITCLAPGEISSQKRPAPATPSVVDVHWPPGHESRSVRLGCSRLFNFRSLDAPPTVLNSAVRSPSGLKSLCCITTPYLPLLHTRRQPALFRKTW